MHNKPKTYKLSLSTYWVEKIIIFNEYRVKKGFSAYECSFLLGKHDFFVRDFESLLKTTSFSPVDVNYLLLIFQDKFENLFPLKTETSNYSIILKETAGVKRNKKHEIQIKSSTFPFKKTINIQQEDKITDLPTDLVLSEEDSVKDYVFKLYQDGYFNNLRTSLEVYDNCRRDSAFGTNFHPRYLIRALDYYTNSKSGEAILDNSKTNIFARRLFFKSYNFRVNEEAGPISRAFKAIGIDSFKEASTWVNKMPYGRNSNKTNVFSLFDEQCGTCSTKHALLKRLTDENQQAGFKLMLGIFPMHADNTPGVQSVLKKYALAYIPEAHNYLMHHDSMLDFTGLGINTTKFRLDLLDETEISPDQITDFKVSYHKDFLASWIAQHNIPYSIDQLWKIREECIEALGEG